MVTGIYGWCVDMFYFVIDLFIYILFVSLVSLYHFIELLYIIACVSHVILMIAQFNDISLLPPYCLSSISLPSPLERGMGVRLFFFHFTGSICMLINVPCPKRSRRRFSALVTI